MAVILNTSLGDIVIDLHTDLCPLTCKNFLKLCKIKYYNNCIFHDVKKDFIAQTGDPTGTGAGGDSLYKHLYGEQARFFDDEIHPKLMHDKIGTIAMASAGENLNASQFYITLRAGLDYLDGKHTVFGEVAEGLDTLMRINEAYVDDKGRPYKNIRIKHTVILDDPFDDPSALADLIPEKSPELKPPAEGEEVRLEDDWVPMDELMDPEELDKSLRKKEAHSRAVVLEMIGDIPDAEMAPPENVLFVCKLNPVTEEDDLQTIFSRFGKIISADIIRDYKTGDSLCYAFIEFETKESCEAAYFKMDNVLIDDRRIHVDFSQSVAKLWTRFRKFGSKDEADNPERKAKGGEKPKYTLKEPAGQRGSPRSRYEMVFEENENASPHDRIEAQSNSRSLSPKNERGSKLSSKGEGDQRRAPRERDEDRNPSGRSKLSREKHGEGRSDANWNNRTKVEGGRESNFHSSKSDRDRPQKRERMEGNRAALSREDDFKSLGRMREESFGRNGRNRGAETDHDRLHDRERAEGWERKEGNRGHHPRDDKSREINKEDGHRRNRDTGDDQNLRHGRGDDKGLREVRNGWDREESTRESHRRNRNLGDDQSLLHARGEDKSLRDVREGRDREESTRDSRKRRERDDDQREVRNGRERDEPIRDPSNQRDRDERRDGVDMSRLDTRRDGVDRSRQEIHRDKVDRSREEWRREIDRSRHERRETDTGGGADGKYSSHRSRTEHMDRSNHKVEDVETKSRTKERSEVLRNHHEDDKNIDPGSQKGSGEIYDRKRYSKFDDRSSDRDRHRISRKETGGRHQETKN